MKLELPHKDILNLLNLNKGQMSEMKRFFKKQNERPEGPKDGDFERIMVDILDPSSYGIEGYEVGDVLKNVTHVSIENHTWKDKSGNVETCKKVVVKSDSCSYEGTHLEFLIKYDFNEPYIVMRVVSEDNGTVEVQLKCDNLPSNLVDIDVDPNLDWIPVHEE